MSFVTFDLFLSAFGFNKELKLYSAMRFITPPLIVLCQCQSQAWIKEKGDVNHLCYYTVSLN